MEANMTESRELVEIAKEMKQDRIYRKYEEEFRKYERRRNGYQLRIDRHEATE